MYFDVFSLVVELLLIIFWVILSFNCCVVVFSFLDKLVFLVFNFILVLDFVFRVFMMVFFFLFSELMILLMLLMVFIIFIGIDVDVFWRLIFWYLVCIKLFVNIVKDDGLGFVESNWEYFLLDKGDGMKDL